MVWGGKMYTVIKWYGAIGQGKVTCFKHGKPKGNRGIKLPFDEDVPQDEGGRLAASISRTRSRVYELAACNHWEWFFTGTLNPEWNDTSDLTTFRKKLTQGLRDFRKASGYDVKYLLIPERHKSGAWHIHGLFSGIPVEKLKHFTVDDILPYKLLSRIRDNNDVYGWEWYSKRFGFTTLTPLRDVAATAAYVTKYVTKDIVSQSLDSNAHSFYASTGLKGADVIAEGGLYDMSALGDVYENDYVLSKYIKPDDVSAIVAKMQQYE